MSNLNLPKAFIEKMHGLLGTEADEFFYALTQSPKVSALRCNTLKIKPQNLLELLDVPLTAVPWSERLGFTYPSDYERRPSKNPLYQAGLYYLQEASAMAPALLLDARPGERLLDLCAAPGGKAAQIAAALQGRGLLVANDASASRSRALVKNLTLCGARNAVILRERPERLAGPFLEFFDKILVDAPCSGEGMFRKDPEAVKAWSDNKPEACVLLQREIMHHASLMLKPGGRLVYSTCTFDLRENEGLIAEFLDQHKDFEAVPIDHARWGFAEGFEPLPQAARLWPHKLAGEGHFICVMKKKLKEEAAGGNPPVPRQNISHRLTAALADLKPYLKIETERLVIQGNILFSVPEGTPDLTGLRVARSGWYLGELKGGGQKERLELSHALALGLKADELETVYDMTEAECIRYLKGESFEAELPYPNKSWVLMCLAGFPLGWARWVNGRLKNKYPPGWINRSAAPS